MDQAAKTEEVTGLYLELWLGFIGQCIDAVAWPLAIFFVAFLFRDELRNVASNLKRLKWGGAEAEFANQIEEAKQVAKTLDPVGDEASSVNDQQTYTLLEQAEVSPAGAVILAYKRVEERLVRVFEIASEEGAIPSEAISSRWSDPKRMPPYMLSRRLHKSGWLSPMEINMLEKLRGTRNLAAHSTGETISAESAKDFVRLAASLEDALQSKINNALKQD